MGAATLITVTLATYANACTVTVPASEGALHRAAAELALVLASVDSAADVTVCLLPGMHTLNGKVLQLGREHNHPKGGRVLWLGHPRLKTTVSGGAPLTHWMRCFDGVHCNQPEYNGVWAHAMSNATPVRQLWVHGQRAARVVSTASDLHLTPTESGYVAGNIAALAGSGAWVSDQVELRWPRQIRNWIEPRCVLSAVAGANLTVSPECWKALTARNNGKLPPPPTFIENIMRPPSAGEFAASRDYIFYRPPADAPYAEPTNAWVPTLGALVNGTGLSNHSFTNLTFSHATWRQPSTAEGYVPSQSAVTPHGEPLGAVRFAGATNLNIERCAFENLGAAYALSVGSASRGVELRHCTFDSLSGGAIKLGNVLDGREETTDPARMDVSYDVSDNVLSNIALECMHARPPPPPANQPPALMMTTPRAERLRVARCATQFAARRPSSRATSPRPTSRTTPSRTPDTQPSRSAGGGAATSSVHRPSHATTTSSPTG
jgi:hypothetical protein